MYGKSLMTHGKSSSYLSFSFEFKYIIKWTVHGKREDRHMYLLII